MSAAWSFQETTVALLHWTQGLGLWAPLALGSLFVAACVVPLPGSVLALASGFLLGPLTGTLTASLGSTAGAAVAFLLGKTAARGWVTRKLRGYPRLATLDRVIGSRPFLSVLVLRLSCLFPFIPLSYALGVTRVSFGQHTLASWLGMFPAVLAYAWMGSAAHSLSEAVAGKVPETGMALWLPVLGMFSAGILLVGIVTALRRRAPLP